jgi:uncharacterized membrane protein
MLMISAIKELPPQKIFLIIGIVYGVLFLVLTPPFQVADEEVHFYKAYLLSEGVATPEKVGNETGFYVSQSLLYDTQKFRYLHFQPETKVTTNQIYTSLVKPIDQKEKLFLSYKNGGVYPIPVAYPPTPYLASTSIMAFINLLFNPSVLFLMYMGRLANLLVGLLLMYMAIKITPVHKWVFMLLALMPMTLFQTASLSVDSFTIAICFLTIAFIFKLSFEKLEVKNRDILILMIFTFLITLSKAGYVIVLAALLMISISKFRSKVKKIGLVFMLPLTYLISNQFWNHFFVLNIPSPVSTPHNSFNTILLNPIHFMGAIINTLNFNLNLYLTGFVGNLGWLDTPLPQVLIFIYVGILVLVALIDKDKLKISLKQKIISVGVFITIFILIFISLYISLTPLGSNMVAGVQGRYFIPVAPLLLILFYNNREKINIKGKEMSLNPENLPLFIILVVLIYLSLSVFLIISRFYMI